MVGEEHPVYNTVCRIADRILKSNKDLRQIYDKVNIAYFKDFSFVKSYYYISRYIYNSGWTPYASCLTLFWRKASSADYLVRQSFITESSPSAYRSSERLLIYCVYFFQTWTLTVIHDPQENAFVLPSGNIFVFTGMIDVRTNVVFAFRLFYS